MKTKEEIDEVYKRLYLTLNDSPHYHTWVRGYTQCQEDMQKDVEYWQGEFDHWHTQAMEMANKKYTEEDIIEKLEMHILINEHDWNRNPQAQLKDFINSLNKQD